MSCCLPIRVAPIDAAQVKIHQDLIRLYDFDLDAFSNFFLASQGAGQLSSLTKIILKNYKTLDIADAKVKAVIAQKVSMGDDFKVRINRAL